MRLRSPRGRGLARAHEPDEQPDPELDDVQPGQWSRRRIEQPRRQRAHARHRPVGQPARAREQATDDRRRPREPAIALELAARAEQRFTSSRSGPTSAIGPLPSGSRRVAISGSCVHATSMVQIAQGSAPADAPIMPSRGTRSPRISAAASATAVNATTHAAYGRPCQLHARSRMSGRRGLDRQLVAVVGALAGAIAQARRLDAQHVARAARVSGAVRQRVSIESNPDCSHTASIASTVVPSAPASVTFSSSYETGNEITTDSWIADARGIRRGEREHVERVAALEARVERHQERRAG